MAKFASVLILLIVLILMNNLAANGTELKKDGAGVLDSRLCSYYYDICLKQQSLPSPPSQG
jgi:hypothetical protein